MRRLVVFNQVTLDGYFAGENGDISWLHQDYKDLGGGRCRRNKKARGGGRVWFCLEGGGEEYRPRGFLHRRGRPANITNLR